MNSCIQIFYLLILQHNFTDGIALGSAFLLYGSVGGWSRTLFLLAHELPQEVKVPHFFILLLLSFPFHLLFKDQCFCIMLFRNVKYIMLS